MPSIVRRGEVYYCNLSVDATGCEQGGYRPVLIIQNDTGNKYSPTTIIAPITGKLHKNKLPTHVNIPSELNYLPLNSVILLEQVKVVDKSRLCEKVCELPGQIMIRVDNAIAISLSLDYYGKVEVSKK